MLLLFLFQILLRNNRKPKRQSFRYFLILDMEATCLQDVQIKPQEVIEMACLILDMARYKSEDPTEAPIFHRFVRPLRRPRLSPFCTKLTGITQAMVDNAEDLGTVTTIFIRKYF